MTTIKSTLKWLLYVLLFTLVLALLIGLWLRHEFGRIQSEGSDSAYWKTVPVGRLNTGLPSPEKCRQSHPVKQAFFGALHVHTAASYDATAFGSMATADQAYRYARGEPMPLRLRSDPGDYEPPEITISSPLDFMAVTDHAETLGEIRLCYSPDSAAYKTLVCRLYRGDLRFPAEDDLQPILRLATLAIFGKDRSRRVCGEDGSRCREQSASVWQENQASAERWQDRSENCGFTTLHGYEYTLAENSSNLHRNVIFRSDRVPQALVSAKEARTPEQLWAWLDASCVTGDELCDALAIPHNSNWSSGRMWFPYSNRELSNEQRKSQAGLRARLEPLAEILQTKGDSECRNGIPSVIGAADEFCDFEKLRATDEDIEDCDESIGSGGMTLRGWTSRYNFVRYALAAGLKERSKLGVNPFEMGIVAATDTHNAYPAPGSEADYQGSHGIDRDVLSRLEGRTEVPGGIGAGEPVRYNPGGLAGVYANENSREALFDAMRKRETFGTSGPRIRPRFFAGWDLEEVACNDREVIKRAYQGGVPMGSVLGPGKLDEQGPGFLVTASRDPKAGLLQRIQIIKAWIDESGRTHQAVFDVAGDPDNGASVDKDTCATSTEGFNQLCATWRDPQFDSSNAAVYYARVLENPSCRWSHWDCIRMPAEQRPASCSNPSLPWQIQERAWTSPIWYYPNKDRTDTAPMRQATESFTMRSQAPAQGRE